jgi:hypothetical protein
MIITSLYMGCQIQAKITPSTLCLQYVCILSFLIPLHIKDFSGADDRIRTCDPFITSEPRYVWSNL